MGLRLRRVGKREKNGFAQKEGQKTRNAYCLSASLRNSCEIGVSIGGVSVVKEEKEVGDFGVS